MSSAEVCHSLCCITLALPAVRVPAGNGVYIQDSFSVMPNVLPTYKISAFLLSVSQEAS